MTKKPYVHSNYARIPDDDYKTIDPRCVRALVDTIPVHGKIVDCCAPSGSGIYDELKRLKRNAHCIGDAFSNFSADWVITNPPYKRGLVDSIVMEQIVRVQNNEFVGFAALLRNNFDFAKSRYEMFTSPSYFGQIHMMFRPWWSEEHEQSPIHNFVWHIWRFSEAEEPFVRYWKED